MRIIKFISPLVFVTILCICIYSCGSENPVINPVDTTYHFDSARYNWTKYDLNSDGYTQGLWWRDSNDIYAANYYGFYAHISNGNVTYNKYDKFFVKYIGSFGNDIAYLIGNDRNMDSSLCRIKKWSGSSFDDIPITNNHYTSISKCYFNKPDEIWITGYFQNRTYKFDGLNLIEYRIPFPNDTNCDFVKLYFDSVSQKMRTVVLTNVNPSSSDLFSNYFIYDFDGAAWTKTGEVNFSLTNNIYTLQTINGFLLKQSYNGLEVYNNNSFYPFLNPNGFRLYSNPGGYSRTNFLIAGDNNNKPPGYKNYLYNWNGQKWSKEIRYSFFASTIVSVSDRVYSVIDNDGVNKISYFYIGTKK